MSSPLAEVRLRELLLLADSGTWGDEGTPENGWPVLRSTNIQDSSLTLHDVAWRVVPEKDEARYKLEEEDILVTKSSGSADLIGKCCVIRDLGETEFLFSNFMLRLRVDPAKATSGWIFYWLTSQLGRARLAAMNTTTTGLRNLNVGRYLDQKVPLPPIGEQRRIAAILDKADAIRRKRQQALALTDELLRSNFLEMFGDPVINDREWPAVKLASIAEIGSGLMKGRDYTGVETVMLPYMRVANVQDGRLDLREIKDIEIPKSEVARYSLRDGDVLVTEGGDPDKLGRGAVWKGEIPSCVHQNHIFRIRTDTQRLLPEYLSALLGSSYGKRHFLRQAKQTTGIATINKTQLSDFPVLCPPLELQARFVDFSDARDGTARRLAAAAQASDALFESLTHQAFTGQL